MGGGFPAAAFGGRADVMSRPAPAGPVYQAGTLWEPGRHGRRAGDPARLHLEVYARLDVVSRAIADAVAEGLGREGVPHTVQWAGRCSASSSGEAVRNYDDARDQSTAAFAAFFHAMLSQGVHLPPSAFEAWFVSAAHDDEAVGHVLAAVPDACRAAARGFAIIGA